jgi:mono/diheme cytochrome c family protein
MATPALAAGDAGRGRSIAETWCASCHAIGADAKASDVAPPFSAVARRVPQDQLRGWLAAPHPPMPNPGLSTQAIEDVIAYIEQLETR